MFPEKPKGQWETVCLKYINSDYIVKLSFENNLIQLNISNSKADIEDSFETIDEVKLYMSKLLGEKKVREILTNWHEVTYRKSGKLS